MSRQRKPTITVFFPCYNDSKTIGKLVKKAFSILQEYASKFEVIVVDDYSSDNSRTVLKKLTRKYPNLKLIFHPKNRGYGGALKSGFKNAKYNLIFYTDGDGQYDVKELPILLSLMDNDVDFVNGIKMTRNDPTYRIILGNLYSFFVRWAFWIPVFDTDCDFRLIRKNIIKQISLKSNSGSICVELIKRSQRAGARFKQVSVHHLERKWGESQFFRPDKLLHTLYELMSLWWDLMPGNRFFRYKRGDK